MGRTATNGARRGSGAVALPVESKRSRGLMLSMRPGEYEDLAVIAAGWGVPVGTAAWAILHERLRGWRQQEVELGPAGLVIAAGLTVLRAGRREVAAERRVGDVDA